MASVVYIVFFVGLFHCSAADCDVTTTDVYAFGQECQYMCHCKNGTRCANDTGYCDIGCATNWFGPSCQYRDLAEGHSSKHNNERSNSPKRPSYYANDGDSSTCSYTREASLSKAKPYWRVRFPQNETISEIYIGTTDAKLKYFPSFQIKVEYVSGGKIATSITCYIHDTTKPESIYMHVQCEQPLVGNQVKIRLSTKQSQLVLCDVRIGAGRNIAYSRPITVSSRYNDTTYGPDKVIDGNLKSNIWDYCFVSGDNQDNWIRLDLGQEMFISYVNITKFDNDHMQNYQIKVLDNNDTWELVYSDANTEPNTYVSLSVTTRYLEIRRPNDTRFIICELQLFGSCTRNKCGYDCSKICHCNGLESLENQVNGICSSGCQDRWTGENEQCDTCVSGLWGQGCANTCGNCFDGTCDAPDGLCKSGCASGYKNTTRCTNECDDGTYGRNCTGKCSVHCTDTCNKVNGTCVQCDPGWTDDLCEEECENGTWGYECNTSCGSCNEGTCNKTDGECVSGCSSGYLDTPLCTEECENSTWGYNCNSTCGNCLNGTCSKSDGKCEFGCIDGFENTPLCNKECGNGTWGYECNKTCGSCNDGTCNKTNGVCESGCSSGYHDTPLCTEECENGTWGYNCNSTCGNCLNGTCSKSDGKCEFGCIDGFENTPLCDQVCASGTYGIECNRNCSINCHEKCNHVDGHCTKCIAGWNGTLCDTECYNGTYGDGCSFVCGKCKDSAACHKVNGSCTVGCATEYEGSLCNIKTEPLVADFPTGAVAGSVSALIVIATVAVAVIFLLRRRHLSLKSRGSTSSLQDIGLNVKSTGEEPDINIKKSDGQNDEYYQFERNVNLENQPRAIIMNELAEFVKTRLTNKEFFDKEFQAIPYGLQFPTTEARKVHNAGKNRYKAMYAYDHSRVVLSTLPSNPHSDYINASYIKGYQKERAYIATQGPTETNVADFWRMIWEKDVQLIAMVTNLVENTKQKCIQYWVPVDDSKEYGDFTVYTESEEIFAEFSIRRLKLSKQGEAIQRNIVQYAYTAWPDKDVPSSTCGLLHYWNKVRKNDENKTHPWLVHCSAGVGRTGTFIALDILYDEAKDAGYVDINMCVRKLREQRVNMVQKEAQYTYLYRIMVEALVLPSTPIALSQFDPWYNEQLGFDSTTGKPKLMLEFEKMVDDIVFVTNTDDKKSEANDCVYANTQIDVNKSKNRYSNILAADEFRPFLSTYVPGTNNYINAVYMPSYNDLHGYLMAQTPLPDTAVDCCRLIIEQEIHVIVTFDDDGDNQVGIYLPSYGSIDIGPFKVTLTSKEEEDGYMIQKYCIVYKTKEHTVIKYIYKKWSTYTIVPEEPCHVLEFLHKVDEQDRLFDNKPTLIQCINGAERSGLFVVLMNVIERARMDEEVSIPQVIRYLRTRRQQIVPNYDQYKFCHDVILCYAESNSTYANM